MRLRCWYVRIVWPASLVLLLIASWPRTTTLVGRVYLSLIDLLGILAGLQGAGWIAQSGMSAVRRNHRAD